MSFLGNLPREVDQIDRAARFRGGFLMPSRIIVIALVAAVVALISPTSASAYSSAPMNFCNKTSRTVYLAYAYPSPGVSDPADHSILTGPFVSQGWRTVDPQKCTTVSNPFDARYIFWFSDSESQSQLEADSKFYALKKVHDDPSSESICITICLAARQMHSRLRMRTRRWPRAIKPGAGERWGRAKRSG
jgi:uncharacterized membrane protein